MRQLSKLVWSEGMYLAPHHFQVQSRYFEDLIHFTTSALWFEPYGLVGYELDREAIRNGMVSLVHARGIFPDGLAFQMPESDPLPAARNITDIFPPSAESLTVTLALPSHRPSAPNCTLEGEAPDGVRYVAEPKQLADDVTGTDEKTVRLGRKNIRISFGTEAGGDDVVALPIARVARDHSGRFIYDDAFIPPCLQIAASEALASMAHRLTDMLQEKAAALTPERRGGGWVGRSFSAQEITSFWFRHAINSSLASLRHLLDSKTAHPDRLYTELAHLAGALCTFRIDAHPRSIPSYDHAHPEKCFHELDLQIRSYLETVLPTRAIPIALSPAGRYLYAGNVTDQRCLDRARWILGIHSKVGESDLIAKTPQLVKVCAAQFVGELVRMALPGLVLKHLPAPPSAIAPRVDSQYFSISRSGRCWEHIVNTRQVGIYVPGELPEPELELMVMLEEQA
jgi:type VI secretion system protein ImpJ